MKIRTISDLPEHSGRVCDDDLFEISHDRGDNKFCSRKLTYRVFKSQISSDSIDAVKNIWDINESTQVRTTVDYTADLSGRIVLGSDSTAVSFKEPPIILSSSTDKNAVQNRSQVIELVEEYTNYISPDSHISIDPKNDAGYTDEYQYMWKIENGKYDSSDSYDEDGFPMESVVIKKTGYLTIYGWLASLKNIEPQNAWVGLYGSVVTKSGTSKWVLLQLQPWIIGQNANLMQYVGFNIPVRKNMRLKIMTGFPVNGNSSGFHKNDGHSLLLTKIGNVPNTFVGYVMET